MGMSMRPYQLGYGYGGGQVTEQDYFGPTNPGHELAQAVYAAQGAKRADESAKALEDERKAQAAWRAEQTARQARLDPLEEAERRAKLRGMGVRMPGEGAPGGTDVQGGLPPAGIMQGSRTNPAVGVQGMGRNGAGAMPGVGNRTQGQDSGFMGPRGMSPLDRLDRDPGFTAHDLPGAFNPVTGTHNPADTDLGGGFTMPYSATPEGRQGTSARELLDSGLLPNMTPSLALYLSQHPEHLAPLIAAEQARRSRGSQDPYGPESLQYHETMRDYEVAHPLRDQPEMTLAGALQEVDRLYGKNMPGGAAATLGADKRMKLAQDMTRRGFNPQHMPPTGFGDATARIAGRSGRPQVAQPTQEEQAGDEASANRNRQLTAVRGMIPKGADPARVREILRQHGVTDEEAEGLINPPAAPAAPRAASGGSRF